MTPTDMSCVFYKGKMYVLSWIYSREDMSMHSNWRIAKGLACIAKHCSQQQIAWQWPPTMVGMLSVWVTEVQKRWENGWPHEDDHLSRRRGGPQDGDTWPPMPLNGFWISSKNLRISRVGRRRCFSLPSQQLI